MVSWLLCIGRLVSKANSHAPLHLHIQLATNGGSTNMLSSSFDFSGVYLTAVLWGHSTHLAGGYVVYWSWLFLSLHCDAMLLGISYIFTLFAHVCDDGATAWHHWKNTITGGSSFLVTIGNADFEFHTSVILSASGNILFS